MLMSGPYKGSSASSNSFASLDETAKGGVCMLELRRAGMVKWGLNRQVVPVNEHGEDNFQIASAVVKEEHSDEEDVTLRALVSPEIRKRKCQDVGQVSKTGGGRCEKQKESSFFHKHGESESSKKESSAPRKKDNYVSRWSIERYKLAEKNMLKVMKAEGAVFDNPISRSMLRMAARKYISDTGLLDHLLKHIDGKVAPGGTERFRRCYNTEGVMEYWLESADLLKIKREAGVLDPGRVSPSGWKPGDQDSASPGELEQMREEIASLKRDMSELVSKHGEQYRADPVQQMLKELSEWRGDAERRMMDISKSLGSLQDIYKGLVTWKAKAEQQITEMSNSIGSLRASKQGNAFYLANEKWEDWLESTNLDNFQGEDLAPWLENTDLVNPGIDASTQELCSASESRLKSCDSLYREPVCAKDLEFLKEEMSKMKRDFQELLPKRMEEDHVVTPDSSVTANSKVDLENSAVVFQILFKDLNKWKEKMEKQIQHLSDSIINMQASQHISPS